MRHTHRSTAIGLIAALAVSAAPLARAETPSPMSPSASLSTLSPASLRVLSTAAPARAAAPQAGAPSERSFFKTGKGAAAIALMAAGAAFTVWSINHDRKPVKSPIR